MSRAALPDWLDEQHLPPFTVHVLLRIYADGHIGMTLQGRHAVDCNQKAEGLLIQEASGDEAQHNLIQS